jgi:hypothetical protein
MVVKSNWTAYGRFETGECIESARPRRGDKRREKVQQPSKKASWSLLLMIKINRHNRQDKLKFRSRIAVNIASLRQQQRVEGGW